MKTDLQTLAHKVVGGWIRFWFPWVRYFEQDAVGDNTFQIQAICKWCDSILQGDEEIQCTDCLHLKDWNDR